MLGHAMSHYRPPRRRPCNKLTGSFDGVSGDVIAVDASTREPLGHGDNGHAGTAADVCHHTARLERGDHAVERGQDAGDEGETRPGAKHALGAVHPRRSLPVIGHAQAGVESLGEVVDEVGCDGRAKGASSEEQRTLFVGEDGRDCIGELEAVVVVPPQEASGRLAAEPFEHPPFMQPGPGRDLVSGERPGARHGPVETEAIPEVDEQRHHLTLLVVPHLECDELDLLGARRGLGLAAHVGRSPMTLTRMPLRTCGK